MGSIDEGEVKTDSCIVCNNVTKLSEQNIGELKSQHSEACMCDLIQRCLDGSKLHRNIDDESNYPCICYDCISKLNEYDLAWITAERVRHELQQMLLQTDQLYIENDVLTIDNIHTKRNTVSDDPDYCGAVNTDNETSDYCVSLGKVEVFESLAPEDLDEDDENDNATSDVDISLKESSENEIQNVVDNAKVKRIYECDTCPEKFNLWKELRVSVRSMNVYQSYD